MKKYKKLGGKIMTFFKVIIGIIFLIVLIGFILQETYFKAKLEKINVYGDLVNVQDGQMHIFSMGTGDKTVVLLPGMGVGLPSAHFSPLMRELSESYTVVTVEYFGVGFSSLTQRSRTTENYVLEIREALKNGGFKPPYILLPHSMSSVYSENYASKYPEEVEAIVSLDGTSTAYYDSMPSYIKYLLPLARFQQRIGVLSIAENFIANKEDLLLYGYTEKEISDMITFAGFSINENLLEQVLSTSDHIRDSKNLDFPKSIAYFKVISKDTYEKPNRQLKISPQEYQYQHLERIGEHAQYEVLEGSHFIYFNNVKAISDIVDKLVK